MVPVLNGNLHFICKPQNHKEGVRRNAKFASLCKKKRGGGVDFSLLSEAKYTVATAVGAGRGEAL